MPEQNPKFDLKKFEEALLDWKTRYPPENYVTFIAREIPRGSVGDFLLRELTELHVREVGGSPDFVNQITLASIIVDAALHACGVDIFARKEV